MLRRLLRGLEALLACGVLALGAAALAALGGSPERIPEPAVPDPRRAPGTAPSPERFRVIAERNLFETDAPARPYPLRAPARSTLRIHLIGTLVEQDEGQQPRAGSLALVRDAAGQVHLLAIGDEVPEARARVVQVEPRRVVLDHQGELQAVVLDDDLAGIARAEAPLPIRGPRRALGSAPSEITPLQVQDLAQTLVRSGGAAVAVRTAFAQLQPHLRGSLAHDADGRPLAYEVEGIEDGSPLQRAGLREGDSIQAINGEALASDGVEQRLFAALTGDSAARLTVRDARGRARDVVLSRDVLEQVVTVKMP